MRPEAPKELRGAPGGDFDSFGWASRASRGAKRGVPEMTSKMDPQKIRILAKKGVWPDFLLRPGGMRGGTGEGTLGEGAENFAENYA